MGSNPTVRIFSPSLRNSLLCSSLLFVSFLCVVLYELSSKTTTATINFWHHNTELSLNSVSPTQSLSFNSVSANSDLSLSLSLCNFFFQVESRHFCFFSASVIERGKLFTLRFLRILPKMPWLAVNENVFYCLGEKEKTKIKKMKLLRVFSFGFVLFVHCWMFLNELSESSVVYYFSGAVLDFLEA